MFETAPYTIFSILLLMVIATVYLRSLILGYAEKHFPDIFIEFKLYEEHEDDTSTLSLYRYIMSRSFEKTNDPIFIAMCNRYMRWGQSFVVSFVIVIIDIDVIYKIFLAFQR
tara:strand:+ start:458 stop:793 length:336 start_codon:yes stop_codon:yes gene_type:complete